MSGERLARQGYVGLMEGCRQALDASSSKIKWTISLLAISLLPSACAAEPSVGDSLVLGSDESAICLDWRENEAISYGLVGLETRQGELENLNVDLLEPQNIEVREIALVLQGPQDNAGSFGYKGSFEQEMSHWNDRRSVENFSLNEGEVWFAYIEAEARDQEEPMSAAGVRIDYTDQDGKRKFQESRIGFGMMGKSGGSCTTEGSVE